MIAEDSCYTIFFRTRLLMCVSLRGKVTNTNFKEGVVYTTRLRETS